MTGLYGSWKRVLVTGRAGFPALPRERDGLEPTIIQLRGNLPK